VHPDKIESHFGRGIIEYLTSHNFLNIPLQVLLNFKPNTVTKAYTEAAANPLNWLVKIFSLWIRGEKKKLKELAPGISFILSMSKGLDRYMQPFKDLFISASWLINIALITTIIVTVLPNAIMQSAQKLLDVLVNWISNGEYNNQIEDYKLSVFKELRQQCIEQAINLCQTLEPNVNWDEEGVFYHAAAEEKIDLQKYKETFDTNIKNNIQIGLFLNFKFILRSLYRAISPLANVRDPAGFGKKVLAIMTSPLRLIFAAILLVASAAPLLYMQQIIYF
jgi:hypothetical protein